jgi:hypothetical protein
MRLIKHLASPLGGAAAILSLFLPWVHLECGDTMADPTLMQLADQKAALYVFVLLAFALLIVALGMVSLRRRGWILSTALVSCLGTAGWIYLWIKKDELGQQKLSIEGMGGSLGGWMQQLHVDPIGGFYLYLAAMLLGLIGAMLWLASPARQPETPG